MGITTRFYGEVVRDISSFGGFAFSAIMSVIFIFMGLISQNNEVWLFFVFGHVALIAIVFLVRLVYFKNRPEKMQHKGVLEKIEASSFPSLHAARGMFCALTIGSLIGGQFVYVLFGLLGGLVGVARVLLRRHDVVDVIFGALLGIGVYIGMLMLV